MKNLFNYKNVRFLKVDGIECCARLFKMHKKLYDLCRRHGAILDLASSDVVIYVEKVTPKLVEKLKKMYPDGQGTGVSYETNNSVVIY